jgi:hypothetical protein
LEELMRSGLRVRVVVPYPNHGRIHPRALASLRNFKTFGGFEGLDVSIVTARGSAIAYNRNIGIIGDNPPRVKQAFDFDYYLSADADIAFTTGDVLSLMERGADIVGGAYRSRADGEKLVAGYFDARGIIPPENFLSANIVSGLVRVDWIGAGFTLVRRRVLEAMEFPYYAESVIRYRDGDGAECGFWAGEDIGFCIGAAKAGFEIYCDCDTAVEHLI